MYLDKSSLQTVPLYELFTVHIFKIMTKGLKRCKKHIPKNSETGKYSNIFTESFIEAQISKSIRLEKVKVNYT